MLCNLGTTTTTTVQQSVPQTQTWPLFSESSAPILRPKLTCFVIYLFSRPPSWQLVRTPKVIRLHNTHTQFRSGTCSKTLPLGALHSLSLACSVFRRIFCFFRSLSVFRRFASPTWPTPKFSPRWVPFRRFRCSRSHTEADRNCRFNTIFPFFVPLFRRLQEGTTFFFFLRGQFPLPLTGYDGHLFHRYLNGDHLSATQSGTFPFRGNFQAAAAPLLLLPCVARGLLFFFFC